MAKSIPVIPKRPGRPATGRDPLLTIRVPQEVIDAIDGWAGEQGLNRSAAVRQLLERGLKRGAKAKREAALDEALDESFPASDPVELGHSDHVGRPKKQRRK